MNEPSEHVASSDVFSVCKETKPGGKGSEFITDWDHWVCFRKVSQTQALTLNSDLTGPEMGNSNRADQKCSQ